MKRAKIKEHDLIVLTESLPAEGLQAGDVGTVVHIYPKGEAYEVEFMSLDGSTIAVATVEKEQARPVTRKDVSHTRELVAA